MMVMIFDLGSLFEYAVNTLDPVMNNSLFKEDNCYYYLALMGRYREGAGGNPAYLSRDGFEELKNDIERLNAVKIHTDYIVNVLKSIPENELTKVVLMDHLDWLGPDDAVNEIQEIYTKVAADGVVIWRSSGRVPWYNDIFLQVGFKVELVQMRDNKMIDRVNMYASLWKATKQINLN